MRPLTIVGLLLLLAGAYILVRGLTVRTHDEVADIGPIEIRTEETRTVPTWIGALVAVAGVGLIVVGSRPSRG